VNTNYENYQDAEQLIHIDISERQREVAEMTPTKVTQGATYQNNEEKYGAANAIDKDLSKMAATKNGDGERWLRIELGKTIFVHKIKIYYIFFTNWYDPNSYCAKSMSNFKKCVDLDRDTDVSVYQGNVEQKSCGTLKLTYGLEQSDQIYTLICNTEGDTVKLSKDKGQVSVAEIVITGPGKIRTFSLQNMIL
jgi:hypothetical protein